MSEVFYENVSEDTEQFEIVHFISDGLTDFDKSRDVAEDLLNVLRRLNECSNGATLRCTVLGKGQTYTWCVLCGRPAEPEVEGDVD